MDATPLGLALGKAALSLLCPRVLRTLGLVTEGRWPSMEARTTPWQSLSWQNTRHFILRASIFI